MQHDVFFIAARIPWAPLRTHGVLVSGTNERGMVGKGLIFGRPFVGCRHLGSVHEAVGHKIHRSID